MHVGQGPRRALRRAPGSANGGPGAHRLLVGLAHRRDLLLVFAGIWALMEGTVDIVRAFEMRQIHKEL